MDPGTQMMSESYQQQDQPLPPVVPVVEQPAAALAPALVAPSSAPIATLSRADPVVPTCNDVISSRYRLTQNNGNAYYDGLVQKYKEQLTPILAKLSARNDTESFTKRILTQGAERVVDIVCRDRGGRFIKLAESSVKTGCEDYTILSRKNAVKKVYSYFRRSLRITQSSGKESTLKAAPEKTKVDKTKVRSLFQYRIQLSSSSEVDSYMLDLITAVCNHAHSVRTRAVKDQIATVARLLETPPVLGIGSTSDSSTANPCTPEADRQTRMRLQLRHRYLAAARVGVSPVDLSQRLIRHWRAGELVLAPPPKLPPVVQAQPIAMAVPPSLPQPEMTNAGITGTNSAVVVAGPEKVQGHSMLTESNAAVALAAFVADPGNGQNQNHGMLKGNNTAVAVPDPLKGEDHDSVMLTGNNSNVAVPDPLKGQDHEDGMMAGNTMRPPNVKLKNSAAPSKAAGSGQWTKSEHAEFLRGLELYGPGKWEKIVPLVPTRTRAQMRARYYRMKKSEESVPGLPKVRKPKKPKTKKPVDPEPREEGNGVERPYNLDPVGQSSVVASATPSIVPGIHAMDSEPREKGIGVECSGIMEPVGQSSKVANVAPSIVPVVHEVPAYQQQSPKEPMASELREEGIHVERPGMPEPVGQSTEVANAALGLHEMLARQHHSPTKEHEDGSEPREEGIGVERPGMPEPVGQSTEVANPAPSIALGLHEMLGRQHHSPTKEPVDDSEPREEGIGVERPDITQLVGQSTAVASAIPAIVQGFHTVQTLCQSPIKEHEDGTEPREEGISVERPGIPELVGQSTELANPAPAIALGLHEMLARQQQPPTKEPVDEIEPREEGTGVERPDITQLVGQSTAVASAIPAIVPGFHTVRAFRQSPTKEHEDDSKPREEGISAQSLDI